MKALRLLAALLFLTPLAHATWGSWTLYYSDVTSCDGSGNCTITPTVTISGNDGGYCTPNGDRYGFDTPYVMLNGNRWMTDDGVVWESGGTQVDYSYTFPSVTLPADGTEVDMSYAGKVQGSCYYIPTDGEFWQPPFFTGMFYAGDFIDGSAPQASPAPCWIVAGFTPACPMPWPMVWSPRPSHGTYADLASQKVGRTARIAVATYLFAEAYPDGYARYTLSCPNGNQNATCGTANYLGSQTHIWAEEFTLYTRPGGCWFLNLVQYKDGPPAPYPCE